MDQRDRQLIEELTEQMERLLAGDVTPMAATDSAGSALAPLAASIEKFALSMQEARAFIVALSKGNLDMEPPHRNRLTSHFKQLHANLRHLTWQTQQIAAGDLNQRVDFLGAFSVAFNSLIDALREKEKAEEQVRYLSIHDPLTDVYNRYYFEAELHRLQSGRSFPVSLLAADLDDLKAINDNLGHAMGDLFIRDAADVMRRCIRANDVIARVGGDEFVLILPQTDARTAASVMARIRAEEAEHNRRCRDYQVRISMGIATCEKGQSLVGTLRRADKRMYLEKAARKEGIKLPVPSFLNGDRR
jgi:diguanylate cyclase (GGDEF)-like protein